MVTPFIVNTSVTLYIYLYTVERERECVNIKSAARRFLLISARTPHVQKSAFYFPLSATKDFLCAKQGLRAWARCFIPTRKYLEKILLRNELLSGPMVARKK
jgi:hypothetical protein